MLQKTWFFMALLLAACGSESSGDKSTATPGVLLVDAGTYGLTNIAVGGKDNFQNPTISQMKVSHFFGQLRFQFVGTYRDPNEGRVDCNPRTWVAKVMANGVAESTTLETENCTLVVRKLAFESLTRTYLLTETGFIERVEGGAQVMDYSYDLQLTNEQ